MKKKKRASFRNVVDHCRSKELEGYAPNSSKGFFAKELGILSSWDYSACRRTGLVNWLTQ